MTARMTITCDGCGQARHKEHLRGFASFGQMRDALKEHGWHRNQNGRYQSVGAGVLSCARDICPTCWGKGIR